jgi:integrase
MKLSQTRADKIKQPGRYGDGRGLYLQITKAQNRSWIFRYEVNGRERMMGLGSCADFSLEDARERARHARRLLQDGLDPITNQGETRAKNMQTSATAVTFREAAEKYFEFHSVKWKNKKHIAQFYSRMNAIVFPVMGSLPVRSIDKAIILKAFQPIWQSKNATAARTLTLVKVILDFAKASGWRDGDNPAAWRGNLSHALPNLKNRTHHEALPFVQIHDFLHKLEQDPNYVAARALEFLILTATRTGEVRFAKWDEIDIDEKRWTIPAERMKVRNHAKRDHVIPLSPRAIEILKRLPRDDSGYVFIGARDGQPLGHQALDQVLKRANSNVTVHGMRSTFSDWAAERTTFANHVVEQALAHAIGNAVEAAYRRGDLLAKRVHLMNDWAIFCSSPQHSATVTPIRARA